MSRIQEQRNQIVKFQNLAEHTKNFSRTVRTQEQLQNDYLAVIEEQKKLTDEIQKKSVLLDEERKELSFIKEGLIKDVQAFLLREAHFNLSISDEEYNLQEKTKAALELEHQARNSVAKSALEKANIEKEILVAREELNLAMRRLEAYKATLMAEIEDIETVRNKEQEDCNKYKDITKAAKQELLLLEQEIAAKIEQNKEEGKKIAVATNGLIEREQEVAKREQNFLILKLRLAKVLDKLYPGQNIDNLI